MRKERVRTARDLYPVEREEKTDFMILYGGYIIYYKKKVCRQCADVLYYRAQIYSTGITVVLLYRMLDCIIDSILYRKVLYLKEGLADFVDDPDG